ncbi:MAG TPA: iron-sulfur cluster insertion protein ErpA [Polyangia bacterium]|jgi:iron-sulfur cluster insertion protein
MLRLTERAVLKVNEIRAAEGVAAELALRVQVVGGGCSGFRYDLFFDEATANDQTIEAGGIRVVVDPMSLSYLDGTEVDYVESLEASGFKFDNPNAKGSCGCGSSFCA